MSRSSKDVYSSLSTIRRVLSTHVDPSASPLRLGRVRDEALYSMRIAASRNGEKTRELLLSLELLDRAIRAVRSSGLIKDHDRVVNEVVSMIASIGRGQARSVRSSVTAMISDLAECLGTVPQRVAGMSRNARKPASESDIRFIVGLSKPEWNKTIVRLRAAKNLLSTPLAARIAEADDRPIDLKWPHGSQQPRTLVRNSTKFFRPNTTALKRGCAFQRFQSQAFAVVRAGSR